MIKIIVLNNVNKIYKLKNNDNFHAVNDVSLTINDGEIVGIVGYSGAGKSTLVRLLNGLIKPDSGSILIDDVNILEINDESLNKIRHNMGMIFQNYNLLSSLTIINNVVLALKIANYSKDKDILENRALEVLELVGLSEKAYEYPKNLSGGQMQRVAIARAIANNPKYLLCDEITSALDNKTANEIVELLLKIQKETKVTIIFISHQLDIVRKLCNRVVVMDKGLVVEDTNTSSLFLNPVSNTSKSLIGTIFDLSKYTDKYLLKYRVFANEKTILSNVIKRFDVVINILEAQTLEIQDNIIGFMVVDIIGTNIKEALDYFNKNDVEVEEL